MKTRLLFCLLLISFVATKAQVTYSIMPAKSLTVTAPSGSVTIFDIYQKNIGASKIVLKWQRISINLPVGWQYSMCDLGTCYSGIPTGPNTMDTVAVNGQGFLGLNIDPSGVAGSGVIKVYVYQNGFQGSGDTLTWHINATIAGIEEITSNSGIKLFPNPAKDILSINLNKTFDENISVNFTDVSGRKVLTTTLTSDNNTIDISGLENGFYNLIIETKNKQLFKRIVKSN